MADPTQKEPPPDPGGQKDDDMEEVVDAAAEAAKEKEKADKAATLATQLQRGLQLAQAQLASGSGSGAGAPPPFVLPTDPEQLKALAQLLGLVWQPAASQPASGRETALPDPNNVVAFPELTRVNAQTANVALGQYITDRVANMQLSVRSASRQLAQDPVQAWALLAIKPESLRKKLQDELAKMSPDAPVIPAWDWLERWLQTELASSEEDPFIAAVGRLLGRRERFDSLEAMLTFIDELKRVHLATLPERFWIAYAYHHLPGKLKGLSARRVDGNQSVEWAQWDEFVRHLRTLGAMWQASAAATPAGGSGAGASQPQALATDRGRSRQRGGSSSRRTAHKPHPAASPAGPAHSAPKSHGTPNPPGHGEWGVFIKGQSFEDWRTLEAARKCPLCKEDAHAGGLPSCPERFKRHKLGEFGFHPRKPRPT
ncbi:hypothetical protein HYH03_010333 [Edaphochlamys debaryana]|uniref:Uncharacterized protein n=1 Tax=Edaphochlamys debaryana TaxID=47281 RepID=A0A835XW64_9CHLO|nr:hypothetical protein HYH03_010333 [Edaphochlamys debaryana]|eukprot:KAG2491328.1 hypothetical protein HYH03_010333 [Edaphochlamys debaryana]